MSAPQYDSYRNQPSKHGPPSPKSPSKNARNRGKFIAGIVVGVVVAVAGVMAFGMYEANEMSDALKGGGSDDRSAGAPVLPGQQSASRYQVVTLDEATPDQFFDDNNFSDAERVNWVYKKLDAPSDEPGHEGQTILEVAHAKLAEKLNKPGGQAYLGELVKPSDDMTGDQINTLFSSISYLSATSDLSENDRIKLQAGELDNSMTRLSIIIDYVKTRDLNHLQGTHEVVTNSETGEKIESSIFRHYIPENGFDPSGRPSKIMNVLDTSSGTGEISQNTIQFFDGKPVIVDSIPATDATRRVTYPQNIPENS